METFGRYQLVRKLAAGGMAEVFLAQQPGLEGFRKLVVVKRILPHLATNQEFITMFLDEARTAARLNHPNIAQVFDLGKAGDTFYLAMEFIHGEDVRRVQRMSDAKGQPLPLDLVCRILIGACEGLYYAHNAKDPSNHQPLNIVHRDVSPQNILVTFDGGVKVVDFGIAKAADQITETRSGVLKGKYAYMSPEQAEGKRLDARSDVFALGVILWELAAGQRLFKRQTEVSTLKAVLDCDVELPSALNPAVPKSFDAIVLGALAKNVKDRTPDCRTLQMQLEQFLLDQKWAASSQSLAEFMRSVFAERLEEEERQGIPLPDHEADDVDLEVSEEPADNRTISARSKRRDLEKEPSSAGKREGSKAGAQPKSPSGPVARGSGALGRSGPQKSLADSGPNRSPSKVGKAARPADARTVELGPPAEGSAARKRPAAVAEPVREMVAPTVPMGMTPEEAAEEAEPPRPLRPTRRDGDKRGDFSGPRGHVDSALGGTLSEELAAERGEEHTGGTLSRVVEGIKRRRMAGFLAGVISAASVGGIAIFMMKRNSAEGTETVKSQKLDPRIAELRGRMGTLQSRNFEQGGLSASELAEFQRVKSQLIEAGDPEATAAIVPNLLAERAPAPPLPGPKKDDSRVGLAPAPLPGPGPIPAPRPEPKPEPPRPEPKITHHGKTPKGPGKPPPAPGKPEGPPGSVVISTGEVACDVFENGAKVGSTPGRLADQAPGQHVFELRCEGQGATKVVADVIGGQVTKIANPFR